jgi:AAA domain (dynein-related subfamily)
MDIKTFKKVLPILRKHNITPFLWGNQGIGKTQIQKQICKEHALGFVHVHAATQDVGDLVGLLHHTKDGKVKHARPEWIPESGQGIIFLDELNRANPEVLQALFSLFTERTIHTHVIPEGWTFVAAGNYQSGDFNVTDTSDVAFNDRFLHVDLKPTVEEFLTYAEDNGAVNVSGFIRESSSNLEIESKEDGLAHVLPSRRSYMNIIAKLDNEDVDDCRLELYSGAIGRTAASAYMSYLSKPEKPISGLLVLSNYKSCRDQIITYSNNKEARLDMLNKTTEEIFLRLKDNKVNLNDTNVKENLINYLVDIPVEMCMSFCDRLERSFIPFGHIILNDDVLVSKVTKKIEG